MTRISPAIAATLAVPAPAAFGAGAAIAAPRTRRQPRAFPLGTCWCEHVIPVMEDMEPCPNCIEAYDWHDCPLMAIQEQHAERAA